MNVESLVIADQNAAVNTFPGLVHTARQAMKDGSTQSRSFNRKGISEETASDKLEEGGDDVKSSWPLCPGLHTCYNGRYKRQRIRKDKQIPKTGPSSDCRLKLACMKLESLVIAYQL